MISTSPMRTLLTLIGTLAFWTSLNAQVLNASFETREQFPYLENSTRSNNDTLDIKEDMNPFYLQADFNGLGKTDVAYCVFEPSTRKQGILILHGEDGSYFILGAGRPFNDMDNFDWMDAWKVYPKKTAERTIFSDNFDIEGSETVYLKNISIQVAPSEGSYNIITWDGTNYIWIHTGE